MLNNKLKLLLSLSCVLFTCILTITYLYLEDNDVKSTGNITYSTLSKGVKVDEVVKLKDINITESKPLNKIIEETKTNTKEEKNTEDNNKINKESENNQEVKEEPVVEKPAIVYDGMTLDELASKLDRSLKNELAGKGHLYASYTIEKGVDPYLAVAISLEETGCNSTTCSSLVKTCNNVGGMKGTGCGMYGYFNTLDEGIKAFIDNIYRNYVAYGLTTANTMNPKYAENPNWAGNVNNYIRIIKSR